MAVAPSALVDKIIVLDYDEEDSPRPSFSASRDKARAVSHLRVQQPAPTHITQSPFALASKQKHVLQAENEKLFSEFVDHCSTMTEDCPQVLTFLQTKHAKACPVYLSSVEFRNSLGRCLTRVQANRSKTFVYINELCTVLRQHADKRRQTLSAVEAAPSTSASDCLPSTSVGCPSTSRKKAEMSEQEVGGEDEKPSTSGLQEDEQKAEKRATRASRKQIAYLERLLKVYNEEICQLQRAELTLDDMGAEDSSYIQEHKLKRKMMKIYVKLCELKGCGSQTGRVIEQKIAYRSTRYPEINRRIERFINSPEVLRNPPDYQDILQQVLLANKRHNLCLSRKQLNQIAQEAFRETGSQIQERRHLDLVYNFGSHLTDGYVPAKDPALMDPSLLRKLRSNREVALSRLEDVISKYAVQQEDTEEQERTRRQGKDGKEGPKAEGSKAVNGVAKEEEEEDDETDVSSDPDIEEEIQASTQQDGADDDNEDDDVNEAEHTNMEEQTLPQSVSAAAVATESVKDEGDEAVTSGLSPLSDVSKSLISPLSDVTSADASPSQSEEPSRAPLADGGLDSAAKEVASSQTPLQKVGKCNSPISNGTRSMKRKRTDVRNHISFHESKVDVLLDMGAICASPPRANCKPAEASDCELVSSSQSPPPRKNKVDVATQCDPQEIIELSDSE
ncbi:death domain-associated protein 6 isoform X2 [Dunckerocampus dactyliophorus]|nr:death domain-associated protein 6 isoform X2 [Dunckerocampus dactyliophorus]XP_054620479.1 death domain-associated protein 6 isoform X2 [Dunckerocampus dactyliophorus]XP_054620480.1 death domain-associated protein 6 isoform X2 [Dunckerocampus dactyliophorus]XP_054620481.1 death domain-associated protein 6 isoform X2 [Dunckerocampus dactyliophorus]